MNSKQIAIKYIAEKIDDTRMIFADLEIFKLVLSWARDCAREFFSTQQSKMFLIHYIDDVALIVDEYLIDRANKMYQNALKKRNKLFLSLSSSEETISWLIDRWINTFLNLTNEKYLNFVDITKIISFDQDAAFYTSNVEEEIEFEKLKRLPPEQIIKALKKVWIDAIYDIEFDYQDFNQLCCQFGFNANEVVGSHAFEEPQLTKYQVEIGQYQLKLLF